MKQEPWFYSPAVPGLPSLERPCQERSFQQEELTRERSAFLLWSPVFWALVSSPQIGSDCATALPGPDLPKIMAIPQAPTKQPQRILEDEEPPGTLSQSLETCQLPEPWPGYLLENREEGSTSSEAHR